MKSIFNSQTAAPCPRGAGATGGGQRVQAQPGWGQGTPSRAPLWRTFIHSAILSVKQGPSRVHPAPVFYFRSSLLGRHSLKPSSAAWCLAFTKFVIHSNLLCWRHLDSPYLLPVSQQKDLPIPGNMFISTSWCMLSLTSNIHLKNFHFRNVCLHTLILTD